MKNSKPFLAITEEGMIVRYNPQIIVNPDDVIKRLANQSFSTIFNFDKFDVATSCNSEKLTYAPKNFNISVTNKEQAIYWSFLPGIIFDSNFVLVNFSGKHRMIPSYTGGTGTTISDRLWWDPKCIEELSNGDFSLFPLIAIVVDYLKLSSANYGNPTAPNMTPYFLFNVRDNKTGRIVANFLPPIPNIYQDGKVCMGHEFKSSFSEGSTVHVEVQRALKWFFESKMNSHLINDSMNRTEVSEKLFGWDENKQTTTPVTGILNILKSKVGNYYIDGLPIQESYSKDSNIKITQL